MSKKIYMRPTSVIYANFKNLRYEPWTAIAEFVDNSTQSFFDHKKELKKINNFKKLFVEIIYKQTEDNKDILIIKDNAYGMEFVDFERAIRIDKPPLKTKGRNEFGMGLKTAACWFGTYWTIVSTQLGSEYLYSASVNVKQIAENQEDYIDYDIDYAKSNEHFTIITITNLNKKIFGGRTTWKIKSLLSSIYREDIRSGEVSIIYNGTELSFDEVEIFKEIQSDGTLKEWKLDVDFVIEHESKKLPVKGFIAIRQKGSVQDAGFALLRRNRVIIGGIEQNYRPKELFGDGNSYTFQRIFGELHMDNWDVTQAKDNFDWHNGGLEEKFIEKLHEIMKELKNKAEKIRVRQTIESKDIIMQAINELENVGVIENTQITFSKEEIFLSHENNKEQELSSVDEEIDDTSVIIKGSKYSKISTNRKGTHYNLFLDFDNHSKQWVIIKNDNGDYYITLNMKHPFFKPLINDSKFIKIMTKFVLSMAIAEIESILVSTDGKIEPSYIRMTMNDLLEESLKIKEDE